ncbi:MAG: MFS transporter [Thermoanaerobacteraceae bacterium]|nr:MFS transporter [Thermoanaerobacteraceae bacterium]
MTKRYDLNFWIRFWGQLLTGIGNFMIMPFMAIYLSSKVGGNVAMVGIIMSLGPVGALIGSLLGGYLADRFGRKPVMFFSLMGTATSLVLFIFVQSTLWFSVINFIQGFCNSLFRPAADAMVSDIMTEKERQEAYGLLRVGVNVGAAIGPLIGVWAFSFSRNMVFLATSIVFFGFSIAVLIWIRETKPTGDVKTYVNIGRRYFYILEDKILLLSILAGTMVQTAYAVAADFSPLYLMGRIPGVYNPTAYMFALNGAMVVFLQLPISRGIKDKKPGYIMAVAALLTGLGTAGIGFFGTMLMLLLDYAVFTVGEMLMAPTHTTLLANIAPEDKRGLYMGIGSLTWISGGFFGPLLAGFIMNSLGGQALFAMMGVLSVMSMGLFRMIDREIERKEMSC